MWNHLGPVDVLRINGLLDALAAPQPSPGAGSAAALVGAMAAAVCAKVARVNDDGGALAQASALSRRLTSLAERNAGHFESALSELERRDDDVRLGRALDQALETPLRIAEACADVAALASELGVRARPDLQADARSATALAAGATRAASLLVEVNLSATQDDARVILARRLTAQAEEAARTA
jgi:methenyltetrahydrofolate cyclohydrolase